jgi:transcriptional regulator with XRE-family HTH domain
MSINVKKIIKKLGPAQRRKVRARAAQLIAEEMTLRELRQARKLTQVRMAKSMGITQDGVSRLEQRADLLLSTLRKTIEAMGGTLSIVAKFIDREPVVLCGISGSENGLKPTPGSHSLELNIRDFPKAVRPRLAVRDTFIRKAIARSRA